MEDSHRRDAAVDDRTPGRPPGYKLPQIVVEGTVRQARNSRIITFKLPLLRGLIELTVLVALPKGDAVKVPVFVRVFVDWAKADAPGSVVVGGAKDSRAG